MKLIFLLLLLSPTCLLAQRPQVGASTVGANVSPFGVAALNFNAFSFVTVAQSNVVSGNADLYTVPAGFRSVIMQLNLGGSTNGSTITFFLNVKTNGNYYRVSGDGSFAAGNLVTANPPQFVFEENETMSVNLSGTGGNIYMQAATFSTNLPLRSVKTFNPGAGNTTLYTVPSGKTAFSVNLAGVVGQAPQLNYTNDSGTARTVGWYVATPGQAVDPFTFFRTSSVSDNVSLTVAFAPLGAGSIVTLSLDAGTTTQLAWVSVLEL